MKDDLEDGRKLKDKDKDKEKQKVEKWEKHEKLEKNEKVEKPEAKETKAEKVETDGVFEPRILQVPDPRLDQVIQTLSGLTSRVVELANQIEELARAGKG